MRFLDNEKKRENRRTEVQGMIEKFVNLFNPLEDDLIVMTDFFTNAYYIEVHILAQKMIGLGTIDVPLDPDEQSEYRANREVVEDHDAFIRMKEDAFHGRTFSNIVWRNSGHIPGFCNQSELFLQISSLLKMIPTISRHILQKCGGRCEYSTPVLLS